MNSPRRFNGLFSSLIMVEIIIGSSVWKSEHIVESSPYFLFFIQIILVLHQPSPVEMASAFPFGGDVISIMTAWTGVMNFSALHRAQRHVPQPCSLVITVNAFPKSGFVIPIMIVAMGQMKRTAVSIRKRWTP